MSKMDMTQDRVAVITGAGSGIGEETSYAFAKRGLSVVLVDMIADRLVKVGDKMKNMGISSDKLLTITQDLSDVSSFDSIINQTITKFGHIDVLVNNAGFAKPTSFDNLTVESADKTYQVMLRAPLFLSQKAFPYLKKTKGCIINVSSIMGRVAGVNSMDYCAIKAGQEHLTRCLALEGASHGIRVNTLLPGTVRTSLISDVPNEDEVYESLLKKNPFGCFGSFRNGFRHFLFSL